MQADARPQLAPLCTARNLKNFLRPAQRHQRPPPGTPPGSRRAARGAPVSSRHAGARGAPAKIGHGRPGEIFANPYRVSIFCLWIWHAAEAPLECRRDAAQTTASASFGLRPLHLNGHFYPVKVIWVTSRTILPVSSTMQMLVSLTDPSSSTEWSMLRFSF
jgi:hypothetical protein